MGEDLGERNWAVLMACLKAVPREDSRVALGAHQMAMHSEESCLADWTEHSCLVRQMAMHSEESCLADWTEHSCLAGPMETQLVHQMVMHSEESCLADWTGHSCLAGWTEHS